MHDVNKWLLALAFLIGLVLTFALMIRRVTREVPVTHTVSAGVRGKLDGPDLDLGKVAGSVAAAGSAAAAGAGATLSGAADRVGEFVETVGDKIEGLFERDIHGAGSARLTARRDAPAGYTVKFDPDTKRYLTAGDAGYAELETEYWFTDEASAKAAGFSRWEEFKDKVGDLVDRAGDKIGAAAGAVGAAAGAVGDKVEGAFDTAADKVGGAFDTAADKVEGAFDTATDKAGAAAGAAGLLGGAVASIDEVEAGPYGRGSAAAGAGGSGPAGWLIKGNADSMLYHPPDSPAYNQTIAEVWFFDEESARKAGFDKWDKNFT